MIKITNGVTTLKVTRGAFKDVFKAQGFIEVSNDSTSVETSSKSIEEQEDSGGKLTEPTPENTTADISGQETDDAESEAISDQIELSEIPLNEMTDKQLKEYAAQLGVDLKGITSRKAVKEKIKSAL